MFLVVVVCRLCEESITHSLKIELLFWMIGPIKTKREEERANGISSSKRGGTVGAFSFVNKEGQKKKDMVSSVYLKRSPNEKKISLSFSLCLVVFKNECLCWGKKERSF